MIKILVAFAASYHERTVLVKKPAWAAIVRLPNLSLDISVQNQSTSSTSKPAVTDINLRQSTDTQASKAASSLRIRPASCIVFVHFSALGAPGTCTPLYLPTETILI